MKKYSVQFAREEPLTQVIDFEGYHLICTGPLAFFLRMFREMKCEEEAVRELYPYLKAEKLAMIARIEKERAAITANNHRSTTREGQH